MAYSLAHPETFETFTCDKTLEELKAWYVEETLQEHGFGLDKCTDKDIYTMAVCVCAAGLQVTKGYRAMFYLHCLRNQVTSINIGEFNLVLAKMSVMYEKITSAGVLTK